MNFRKMIDRLRQSAKELNDLSERPIGKLTDDFLQYEFLIKFNEINKIVSILQNMLVTDNNSAKENDSVHLLNE